MAGEDFSFITQKVPSAFIFLGIRNETAGSVHGLHTAKVTMDESALKQGAALHTHLAINALNNGFEARSAATAAAADGERREESDGPE